MQLIGSSPKAVEVPQEIKQKVIDRINLCIAIIQAQYNVEIKFPTITYDLRGRTAGQAKWTFDQTKPNAIWQIRLNSILLMENLHDMLMNTVPHEVAHLAVYAIHGRNAAPHGVEWANVMYYLGLNATRTHNYNTANSRVR